MFDTYTAINELKEAGFEEKQAAAMLAIFDNSLLGTLATKADLTEVKSELKTDIANLKTDLAQVKTDLADTRSELKGDIATLRAEMTTLRAEVKADIANLRATLYWQMLVMGLTIVGLTVTLIKLIP